MFFASVFKGVSIFNSVFAVVGPPWCGSGLVVKCMCLWDVLCCCFKDDVCELVYSGVWAYVVFDVGSEAGPIRFLKIPSGKDRKWGEMSTYCDMDGKMITKERIVSGGPVTGWGEEWRCGSDVWCSVVICVSFCREGVGASAECDHVKSVKEIVEKFANSIWSTICIPNGVMTVEISTEEDRSLKSLDE